jgi:hypothetical protein
MVWLTSLGHETSPGTKELLWGDMSALSSTGFLNVTLLFGLDTGESLGITFVKLLLFMALLTALTTSLATCFTIFAVDAFWMFWISLVALLFLLAWVWIWVLTVIACNGSIRVATFITIFTLCANVYC